GHWLERNKAYRDWTHLRYTFLTPHWPGPRAATLSPVLISGPGEIWLKSIHLVELGGFHNSTAAAVSPERVSLFSLNDATSWSPVEIQLATSSRTPWRLEPRRTDLLDVRPLHGVGPAVLHVVPKRTTARIDEIVELDVVSGAGQFLTAIRVRFKTF